MINKEKILNIIHVVRTLQLHQIAQRSPRIYLMVVFFLALTGYGFLLSFPLGVLFALSQLFTVVQQPLTVQVISLALFWFASSIFCIAMSHHIFTVRFESPKGPALQADHVPQLFNIIEDKKHRPFWPKFNQVLLSDQFELEVYKTPVTGIPLWSKNTLVIGFPLMQTLPEDYFTCALVRKLIQVSKGRNVITNWLYQLRYIWTLYPKTFASRNLLGEQIIVWFFKFYAPLYAKISLFAAQQEELHADSLALTELNDYDLFRTLESQVLMQHFFHKIYMPMLKDMVLKKHTPPAQLTPYSTLQAVLKKTLSNERMNQWLALLQQETINTHGTTPTFSQRMQNMGQRKIRLPNIGQSSAAEIFLGARYKPVVHLMDKIWSNKTTQRLQHNKKHQPSSHARPLRLHPAVQ